MRLLYPCNPFEKTRPDEVYAEEFRAAQSTGLSCSLYSAEDFELGKFNPRPPLLNGEYVVYRGWMLTPNDYLKLESAIESRGGHVLTSSEQYRLCHYLPEWYSLCEDLTPRTIFLRKDADFSRELVGIDWSAFFVKDYVKSLTTSRGSVAHSPDEIGEIVASIEKYRGQVEGGVCIREFEDLKPETEERYFVFMKRIFAHDGVVPEIVEQIAQRMDSPFFPWI